MQIILSISFYHPFRENFFLDLISFANNPIMYSSANKLD